MATENMEPTEIIERRDRFTKHFLTGYDADGNEMCRAEKYPGPIHYQVDGEWVDILPVWSGAELSGVPYSARLDGVGCDSMRLLDYSGSYVVEGHRVWWRDIAPQTDAVLIASAAKLQLHLILHGPHAPREFRFWCADMTVAELNQWHNPSWGEGDAPHTGAIHPKWITGGRDNIEAHVTREGREQNYELEIEHAVEGNIVTKTWTGRVKAFDKDRRKHWSKDVAYPVRIM